MSHDITLEQRRAFQNTLESAIQQTMSKLRGLAQTKTFSGKMLVLTERGTVEFTEEFSRHEATNPSEEAFTNRAMVKRAFKSAKLWARNDATYVADLSDPASSVYAEFTKAWNRTIDQLMIDALVGNAYGGDAPYTTAIALPSAQIVPANYTMAAPTGTGSNTPLNPSKLRRARTILEKQEVPIEDMVLVLSPQHDEGLAAWLEAQNNDVAAGIIAEYLKDPRDGKILYGMTVRKSNRLPLSGTVRTAIAYDKGSLMISPDTMESHLDLLVEKSHSKQAACYGMFAASRRREEGVVSIGCEVYE